MSDDERTAITAAMQRLLAGRPLRSSGDLTIVALAEEAGLGRNKLTHKHTDLRDLFYAEAKARNGIPASEIKLREQITALKARIESLRQERDDYRASTETFARAINALTVENDTLRKEPDKRRSPGSPHCLNGRDDSQKSEEFVDADAANRRCDR
jgi:chromosome segregation ATPase